MRLKRHCLSSQADAMKRRGYLKRYCLSSQADAIKKICLSSQADAIKKLVAIRKILPLVTSRCDQKDTASPHKQMR